MVATSTGTQQSGDTQAEPSRSARRFPAARPPVGKDFLAFFVAIPAGIAFVFSLVGMRLITAMPYFDGLVYMLLHMFIAWWTISLGAAALKFAFRSWQPPGLAICVLGYLLAIIPAAFLYQWLGDLYGSLYPVFAANRADAELPSWELAYLIHFIRYSIPALPLFLTAVYAYRFITGVNWFGYKRDTSAVTPFSNAAAVMPTDVPATPAAPVRNHSAGNKAARANLIEGSRLPAAATLLAIKAEQHYIQIWSDMGTDLVRFRFKDLDSRLHECNGAQVHRSWWVNLDEVRSCRQDGRRTELLIRDDLIVPVSISYKHAIHSLLAQAQDN